MAEPLVSIISIPNNAKISISGTSQNFFLVRRNNQNSFKNDISLVFKMSK
jgi:hypothetical protein